MSTAMVKLASDLQLPIDLVTEAIAVLGRRGKGKTHTAAVLVEGVVHAGVPVCVIDTVGVWWGLRSSKSGKGPGLPIVVFGGRHGDIPLEEASAKTIAQLIIDRRISAVIDTSELSKAGARRFLTEFLVTVYRLNHDPFLFVFDEADELAPQKPYADGARLLGAMEDFVRRGRARGLGSMLITQRPAVLNKDVLTQVEVLIAHGFTGPRDVAAIDEWIRLHADEADARRVKGSLASLPTGTAWVWSPSWLGILKMIKVTPRKTFDSSATPKVGTTITSPAARAKIDLEELAAALAQTVERAAAEDPRLLRKHISVLEKQLAEAAAVRPDPQPVEIIKEVPVEVPVPVPALSDQDRRRLTDALEQLEHLSSELAGVRSIIAAIGSELTSDPGEPITAPPAPKPSRRPPVKGAPPVTETPPAPRPAAPPPRPAQTTSTNGLGKADRAILAVLATYGPRTHRQIALQSGYSGRGGGFNNALGKLRSSGRIVGGRDRMEITQTGVDDLGEFEPLPQGQGLIDHWLSTLGKAERGIFTALVDAWPASLSNAEIADLTGYEASGGGFNNALGRLRTLDLIHGTKAANTAAEELGAARNGLNHA